MIKYIILFVLLLFYVNANSQPSVVKGKTKSSKVGLSVEELATACDEYKKMINTETYLQYENKTRLFAKKTNDLLLNPPADFWNENVFMDWIEKNIRKTDFKSIKEAREFIEDMKKNTEKLISENKHLYELMAKATPEQIGEISQPFFNRAKSVFNN